MAIVGNVEVYLPYGGDLVLTANGDLKLLQDTPIDPAATVQRLERLLLQCPALTDQSGNPIAFADDLFNPQRGAGLPVIVGETVNASLVSTLRARILAALASEPDVAQSPAPTVNVTDLGGGAVQIDVSLKLVTGNTVTIPSFKLGG